MSECYRNNYKKYKAFSLFEVLLVLALLSLLLLAGLPNWFGKQRTSALVLSCEQTKQALQYARTMAISQQQDVKLCPWHQGQCGQDWQQGILVQAQSLQHVFSQTPEGVSIRWQGSFAHNYLSFNALGFTNGTQGSFYFDAGAKELRLIISRAGRFRGC